MNLPNPSQIIADNQKSVYVAGLVIGLIAYLILLFFNDWNPISLVVSVIFLEFSVMTGVVMRFLSGLGITLTYVTFCVLFFRILSPSLKNRKTRTRLATTFILVPAVILGFYSMYKILGALLISQSLSSFEIISTIFGVWSLLILVYILPAIRGEYAPDLDQTRSGGVQQRVGKMRFSIWKGYQSRVRRNYGRVAEAEFERFSKRLFLVRVVLSGLLLLPLSLILIVIPPLTIFGILLWLRVFSLSHRHFSNLERGLLVLVTLSVAIITTSLFLQPELVGFNLFFDTSYGIGLLIGLVIFFAIFLSK
jgi:hypothetical protein